MHSQTSISKYVGFDAHRDDPLASVNLADEDYYWITRRILLSALRVSVETKSRVKVMSVLEGGYDLDAIARCAALHVKALHEGYAGVQEIYYSTQKADAESATMADDKESEEKDTDNEDDVNNGAPFGAAIDAMKAALEEMIESLKAPFRSTVADEVLANLKADAKSAEDCADSKQDK
jgi:hypothetical protein